MKGAVLVHLSAGVGNIVFSTPLLAALRELQLVVDLLVSADYPQTLDLLRPWSLIRKFVSRADATEYECILPAVPPFYWPKFERSYRGLPKVVQRPPDSLFYRDEQDFYLEFARRIGFSPDRSPFYRLPIVGLGLYDVGPETLVIAPGSKSGEMALKRWPWFPELANRFENVVLVGTGNDLQDAAGRALNFPSHVRSLVDRLTLRETAEVMASAGAVVGNDSGLSHVAGAVGTPTLILFGPTPNEALGRFPSNVYVLRAGLRCEPCWFARRFEACQRRIDCLREITIEQVENRLRAILEGQGAESHECTLKRH